MRDKFYPFIQHIERGYRKTGDEGYPKAFADIIIGKGYQGSLNASYFQGRRNNNQVFQVGGFGKFRGYSELMKFIFFGNWYRFFG